MIYTFDEAAGEALGKRESHTPKIEAPDRVNAGEPFEVTISVGPHPNKVEHSIRWIEIYFREDERAFNPLCLAKLDLTPIYSEPEVCLKLSLSKGGTIIALQYCNVHGLWSAEKSIRVD